MPPKTSRYPVWSAKAITIAAILVVASIYVLVFWLSYSSIIVEFQITLMVIAIALFAFLAIGLYKGVRLERPHVEQPVYKPLRSDSTPSVISNKSKSRAPTSAQSSTGSSFMQFLLEGLGNLGGGIGGDDLAGCLTSILVWIGIAILFVIILPLLAEIVWATIFVLLLAFYWIFYKAFRLVFAKSRMCRGQLLLSIRYSLLYTVLYTGWLAVVLWIGRYGLSRG